jgi:hypothetical protein
VELPVLIIPSLYKSPLRIIEIGQPWRSMADPSAELNVGIRGRGNWTISITKGCSLKCFRMILKRLQEAILRGRVGGIIRPALPFFTDPLRPDKIWLSSLVGKCRIATYPLKLVCSDWEVRLQASALPSLGQFRKNPTESARNTQQSRPLSNSLPDVFFYSPAN